MFAEERIDEGALLLRHPIQDAPPHLVLFLDGEGLIGEPREVGVDAQLEEAGHLVPQVSFLGLQPEAEVLELDAGLGLTDAAEAFEVRLQPQEELLVAILGLEVVGVEILEMGNWGLVGVVVDPGSPVHVLFRLLDDSQLDQQPLIGSFEILAPLLLGLYLVLGEVLVNRVHREDLLGSEQGLLLLP